MLAPGGRGGKGTLTTLASEGHLRPSQGRDDSEMEQRKTVAKITT